MERKSIIPGQPAPTRTPETLANYARVMETLFRGTFAHLNKIPADAYEVPAPSEILDYMDAKIASWRPSTINQYKAAFTCWLEESERTAPGNHEFTAAWARLNEMRPITPKKEIPPRNSAKKQKTIQIGDIADLARAALNSETQWELPAVRFLQASIATGLRPIEWAQAYFQDPETLVVRNAKHTNGRGRGPFRSVTIPKDHWLFDATHEHYSNIQDWAAAGGNYRSYYVTCRSTLYRLQKKLWPKRAKLYSLYSGRHQFSANLKATDATTTEVAEAMGHKSERTAQKHYARKRSGWLYRPAPDMANGLNAGAPYRPTSTTKHGPTPKVKDMAPNKP